MRTLAILMFSTLAIAPVGATPKNISELATTLGEASDPCSSKAKEFNHAEEMARFKNESDKLSNEQEMQTNVELDRIRQGNSHADTYKVELLQQQLQRDGDIAIQDATRIVAEASQIDACLQSAEIAGKEAYSGYKKTHPKKNAIDEAALLMAAWLVNLKTVSVSFPQGTDVTRTSWESAKARAEIDAL